MTDNGPTTLRETFQEEQGRRQRQNLLFSQNKHENDDDANNDDNDDFDNDDVDC